MSKMTWEKWQRLQGCGSCCPMGGLIIPLTRSLETRQRTIHLLLDNQFYEGIFTSATRLFSRIDGSLTWSETYTEAASGITVTNERYGNAYRFAFFDEVNKAYQNTTILGAYTTKHSETDTAGNTTSVTNEYVVSQDPNNPTLGICRRVSFTSGYPESPNRQTWEDAPYPIPSMDEKYGWNIKRSSEITIDEISQRIRGQTPISVGYYYYEKLAPNIQLLGGAVGGLMYGSAICLTEVRWKFIPDTSVERVAYYRVTAKSSDTSGWLGNQNHTWEVSDIMSSENFFSEWFGEQLLGHDFPFDFKSGSRIDFTDFMYTWTHGQKFKIPPVPF